LKDTNNKDFWEPILNSKVFQDDVYNNYGISSRSIISDDDIAEEFSKDAEIEEEYEGEGYV